MTLQFVRMPLLIFLFFTLIQGFTYNEKDAENLNYGIIMDAGSSGTRLHVYAWPDQAGSRIPDIAEAPIGELPWIKFTKPGISSFASQPSNVGTSLKPLTDWAITKIPQSKIPSTVIYLKATAGMRLLSPEVQNQILDNVRNFLSTTPFMFRREWATVITGDLEGLFGWVTVNFLLGTLRSSGNLTVGALDMGGASTQIVFETHDTLLAGAQTIEFSDSQKYNLYDHSYLGYGADQAAIGMAEYLIKGVPSGSNVDHPCLPIGFNPIYVHSFTNESWYFIGSSNFTECHEIAIAILGKDDPCEISPCPFDGVYMPSIDQKRIFYAFNGYAFFNIFMNLPSTARLDEILDAARDYCDMTWDEIQITFNSSSPYLPTYCTLGTWVITMLHDGYGFPLNGTSIVTSQYENDVQLGWTLGAMLYEADLVDWQRMCAESSTCGDCLKHSTCGWCGSSGSCQPIAHPCDAQWNAEGCDVDDNMTKRAVIAFASVGGAAVLLSLGIAGVMIWKKRQEKRRRLLFERSELDEEESTSLVDEDEWK